MQHLPRPLSFSPVSPSLPPLQVPTRPILQLQPPALAASPSPFPTPRILPLPSPAYSFCSFYLASWMLIFVSNSAARSGSSSDRWRFGMTGGGCFFCPSLCSPPSLPSCAPSTPLCVCPRVVNGEAGHRATHSNSIHALCLHCRGKRVSACFSRDCACVSSLSVALHVFLLIDAIHGTVRGESKSPGSLPSASTLHPSPSETLGPQYPPVTLTDLITLVSHSHTFTLSPTPSGVFTFSTLIAFPHSTAPSLTFSHITQSSHTLSKISSLFTHSLL